MLMVDVGTVRVPVRERCVFARMVLGQMQPHTDPHKATEGLALLIGAARATLSAHRGVGGVFGMHQSGMWC